MELPGSVAILLFDFDGTLVHLNTDYASLRADLARLCGAEPSLGVGRLFAEAAAQDRQAALRLVAAHEGAGVATAELCAGASELLRALASRNLPFAIVTRNHSETVRDAFRRFDLPAPAAIVAIDSPQPAKPDPEGTRALLRSLAIEAERAVLLGDASYDVELAARLGIALIVVPNSRLSPPEAPSDAPRWTLAQVNQWIEETTSTS